MRIAIAGSGAIGSVIGAYLMRGGHEVSLLARGAHLAALRSKGLTLHSYGKEEHFHPVRASDRGAELGPQDFVICTAKAHSLPPMVDELAALTAHPDTLLIAAQNGIPWWYFHGLGGTDEGPFELVDPGAVLWRRLNPARVAGGIIIMPAHIPTPGTVVQGTFQQLILGAPKAGDHAEKLARLADALKGTGFDAPVTPDIRLEVWKKLWSNVAFGPASVLTHATVGQTPAGPGMFELIRDLVHEVLAVAKAWGYALPDETQKIKARIGSETGRHQTSMLQDFEAGRPLELDAIVAAPVELARRRGVKVPLLEAVLALSRLSVAVRDGTAQG